MDNQIFRENLIILDADLLRNTDFVLYIKWTDGFRTQLSSLFFKKLGKHFFFLNP